MTAEHFRNIVLGTMLIAGSITTASYTLTEQTNYKNIRLKSGKTSAVISSIDYTSSPNVFFKRYDVKVRYTVDGKEYTSGLNEYNSSMALGSKMTVYYDKENPSRTISEPAFIKMLFALSGIELGVGLLILIADPE